jgi:chaperonin GroES
MDDESQEVGYDNEQSEDKLGVLLESVNIAEKLDDDKLREIGDEAKTGFESDLQSRSDWEEACEQWLKLAKQVAEKKTYPWPNASNVKYPLLSTAAMQFAARAYPSLVPASGRVVNSRPLGKDPDGAKGQTAEAVSIFMSYQLMHEMEGWEEDMDKLLIMLPILGTMFKKTYWDSVKKVNCSRLVLPKNLVVDYWTHNLKDSERISEIIEMSPRKVKERQNAGLWLDLDLGPAPMPVGATNAPQNDLITPYTFIEQHTFLDLDDDGYREPYIVTFQRETGKVVRIAARFDDTTIYSDPDTGDLIKIEPIQYYTKFGFVPNPDGSFYDIGFGVLLGPLNESVNTLINQLVDAGHLASLQGGFLGKGLRLRMGETRFQPGEWKVVNATGDDLKKQIVPLPVKEPSQVLFELMNALIQSGKELASVAEIFVGKMPGQNTPATTTMASIEQGMKVFTAVYKRIYRSLDEEFQKLYRLNGLYLNPNTYVDVVDMEVGPDDFDSKTFKVFPAADPSAISQSEKLMKAQGLLELLPIGVLDPLVVIKRVLDAQEQPNAEELFNQQVRESGQMPEPPPDPKLQEMQMKGQLEQQKMEMQGQAQQQKSELEARSQQTQLAMKAQEHAMEMQHKAEMNNISRAEALHKQRIFSAQAQQKMVLDAVQGHQKVQHTAEMGKAKVEATKAQAKAKPQTQQKGAKK